MKILFPVIWLIVFWAVWIWGVCVASADVILYKTPSMEVIEAFREPIPLQPGYNQVAVLNADLIVWPTPSGCTQGQRKWAIVNISTIPPLFILNPALKFFRCQSATSAADVDRIVEEEVMKLSGPRAQQQMKQMRQAIQLLDVLTVECPPGSLTVGCDTKRTNALNTRTKMLNLNSQVEQIYSDAATFKTSQGW